MSRTKQYHMVAIAISKAAKPPKTGRKNFRKKDFLGRGLCLVAPARKIPFVSKSNVTDALFRSDLSRVADSLGKDSCGKDFQGNDSSCEDVRREEFTCEDLRREEFPCEDLRRLDSCATASCDTASCGKGYSIPHASQRTKEGDCPPDERSGI